MRKMKRESGETLNIIEHIILRNYWEYYITDRRETDDVVECLVLGFEHEIGDVYLPELTPYIISRTNDLTEVAPAPKWQWV